MEEKELDKLFNYVFENIVLKLNYPITNQEVVELLLSLKDSKNKNIFEYTFKSDNSIELNENSKQLVNELINNINEKKKVIEETLGSSEKRMRLHELEQYIKDTKIDPDDGWTADELEELKKELAAAKEEAEKLHEELEDFLKFDEVINILEIIKKSEVVVLPHDEKFELLADESILLEDFNSLFKGLGNDMIKRLLYDLEEMAKKISISYDSKREVFDLQTVSAQFGNGIHITNEGKMFKDKTIDIRIIIVQKDNKFYIRGIVGGHSDDNQRRNRFDNANNDINVGNESETGYQDFVATLKNKLYKNKNQLTECFDIIVQHVLEQAKRKEEYL